MKQIILILTILISKQILFASNDSLVGNFAGSSLNTFSSFQSGNRFYNLLNSNLIFSNNKVNSVLSFSIGRLDGNLFFTLNNIGLKFKDQPKISNIDSSILSKQKDSLEAVKRVIEVQTRILKQKNNLDSNWSIDSIQNIKDSLIFIYQKINHEISIIQNKFEDLKNIQNKVSSRIEFGSSPFKTGNLRNGICNPKYGFVKKFDFGEHSLQTFSGITGSLLRTQFNPQIRTLYFTLGQKLTSNQLKGFYLQNESFLNAVGGLKWESSEVSIGRLWFNKIIGQTDIRIIRFIEAKNTSNRKIGLYLQNNYYSKKYSRDLYFETRPIQKYYSDFTMKERINLNFKNIFFVNKKVTLILNQDYRRNVFNFSSITNYNNILQVNYKEKNLGNAFILNYRINNFRFNLISSFIRFVDLTYTINYKYRNLSLIGSLMNSKSLNNSLNDFQSVQLNTTYQYYKNYNISLSYIGNYNHFTNLKVFRISNGLILKDKLSTNIGYSIDLNNYRLYPVINLSLRLKKFNLNYNYFENWVTHRYENSTINTQFFIHSLQINYTL